jgi:hypothetical protein
MRLIERADGLHEDVPAEEYHERVLGLVSNGALDRLDQSPAHYRTWIDAPKEEATPALFFGKAFHCALLEPSLFARIYAAAPEFGDLRFKENKAKRDVWRKENEGRIALSASDDEAIRQMCTAVTGHPLAGKMVRNGVPELTLLWTDATTGLRCRARADYYVEKYGMVLDIKSADDASPEAFRRAVFKYRYHRQHALYREGFSALKARAEHFVFVAVEKVAPYAVGIYALDANGVAIGYGRVRSLMDAMAECIRNDSWPGYAASIQTIETPPWAA